MSPEDAAWLAGLLEGEGCFSVKKPHAGRYRYAVVAVAMTDRDTIERAAEGLMRLPFRRMSARRQERIADLLDHCADFRALGATTRRSTG